MKKKGEISIILCSVVDEKGWETAFQPFRFIWAETDPLFHGFLMREETAIADVHFHPLEMRMEFYPLATQQKACLELLALPSFQALARNTVTVYAERQMQRMGDLIGQLQQYESLHDFRVALRKFRTILPHLLSSSSDSEKKMLTKRLKKITRLSGEIRDREVMHKVFASYGLEFPLESETHLERVKALQDALDQSLFARMAQATEASLYRCASLDPARLVTKQHKALVQAVHAVHSSRDIKAMHRVRKQVKALRYLRELALLDPDPLLSNLQDCLGVWHDLIMVQDELQARKELSLDEKQALVDLQRDIEERLSEYRTLTTPFWEERL